MTYSIHIIKEKDQLQQCPNFQVDQYNWGGDYRPATYGTLAYLDQKGFLLSMTSEETKPLCIYRNDEDPVYKDSAMEAFFNFSPTQMPDAYVNIEMNSAGAMLNHFGHGRSNRKVYTELTNERCTCQSTLESNKWTLDLFIPIGYIYDLFQLDTFRPGDKIRMNFYKICEMPDLPTEHYASFSKINNPKPNFHLPEYFAEGIII